MAGLKDMFAKAAAPEAANDNVDPRFRGLPQLERALLEAAEGGDWGRVAGLVSVKSDLNINVQDNDGRTAMQLAALRKHKKIVAELLDAGAQFDIPDRVGQTLAHHAAAKGMTDIIKRIGRHPVIHQTDHGGMTPLHYAATEEAFVNAGLALILNGARIDAKDKMGMTPASIARNRAPRYSLKMEELVSQLNTTRIKALRARTYTRRPR